MAIKYDGNYRDLGLCANIKSSIADNHIDEKLIDLQYGSNQESTSNKEKTGSDSGTETTKSDQQKENLRKRSRNANHKIGLR